MFFLCVLFDNDITPYKHVRVCDKNINKTKIIKSQVKSTEI